MPADAPRPRILVVDDEEDIRDGLKTFLATEVGAEVLTAASGAEGLDVLRRTPVDLILSDYKMPGMDGLRFLERAREVRPGAACIMATAYPDLDLALQALNDARILHFFTKPLDPAHLSSIVRAILDAQKALRVRDEALRRSLERMRQRPKTASDVKG